MAGQELQLHKRPYARFALGSVITGARRWEKPAFARPAWCCPCSWPHHQENPFAPRAPLALQAPVTQG